MTDVEFIEMWCRGQRTLDLWYEGGFYVNAFDGTYENTASGDTAVRAMANAISPFECGYGKHVTPTRNVLQIKMEAWLIANPDGLLQICWQDGFLVTAKRFGVRAADYSSLMIAAAHCVEAACTAGAKAVESIVPKPSGGFEFL